MRSSGKMPASCGRRPCSGNLLLADGININNDLRDSMLQLSVKLECVLLSDHPREEVAASAHAQPLHVTVRLESELGRWHGMRFSKVRHDIVVEVELLDKLDGAVYS